MPAPESTQTPSEDQAGWHVDKSISVGHIMTTVTLAFAAILFAIRLEGRIDPNTYSIRDNSEAIERVEKSNVTQYEEIIRRLERISDKLDSKADK